MSQFRIVPDIYEFQSFKEFAGVFKLNSHDLVITQKVMYEPYMEPLKLKCHFVFQESFGGGEPTDRMVNRILTSVEDVNYDRVIAIGGGTVIDISKILSLTAVKDIEDVFENPHLYKKEKNLIIIPTTCGTGSEVTRSVIIHSTGKESKVRLTSDDYFASSAVLIPELLGTLPYEPFILSAIDAMVHGAESYLSPRATSYTELFSLEAVRLLGEVFVQMSKEGKDSRFTKVGDALKASNYAGIAFGNAGCGAVHALSYPLSGRYGVNHGQSNYQFFTEVLYTYYRMKPEGKITNLLECFAGFLRCDKAEAISKLSELLETLFHKKKLHEFGMKEEEIKTFSEEIDQTLQGVLATNYVPLSIEDLLEIHRKLY